MNCYACEHAAVNACRRCAKPYCDDHGNAQYCAECLKPASALPSFNLYRGALLALLVGTGVAIVLLVRPPGETKGASPVVVGRTAPSPTASGRTAEATIAAETPETTPSPDNTTATPVANVTATPTEAPYDVYFVQSGDNLFSIAEKFLPPGDDLKKYTDAVVALNGLSSDQVLSVGQKLLLPKHR